MSNTHPRRSGDTDTARRESSSRSVIEKPPEIIEKPPVIIDEPGGSGVGATADGVRAEAISEREARRGRGGDKPARSRIAIWRQVALRRHETLHLDLVRARARLDTDDSKDSVLAAEADEIESLLDDARSVAEDRRVSPLRWWSGAEIERTWRALRETEERLVDLAASSDLQVAAAQAVEHARAHRVSDGDATVLHLQALRLRMAERWDTIKAAEEQEYRAAVRGVLAVAHGRADQFNQEARALRNRLLSLVVAVVAAAVVLVVAQGSMADLRLMPTVADWTDAGPLAVLHLVMLAGAFGALLTVVPVLAAAPTDFSPFNLPVPQALVKVVTGTLTAVAGVLVLKAVEVNGLSSGELEVSVAALFVLAMAFGASQQAVTRLLDKRAAELLTPRQPQTSG
jgi:hypothetical protein